MKMNLLFPSLSLITTSAIGLGWSLKSEFPVTPAKTLAQPALAASLGETLFDAHHQKAVTVFDQLPGFGFSRILPVIQHDLKRSAPSEHRNLFTDHDFTFIGNDAAVRRDTNNPASENAAIFKSLSKAKTSVTPANEADLAALKILEADPESRRHFRVDGDAIISYGPLRATASCAKCHGVEEGTLLGMFRYRFDLKSETGTALAAIGD
jgi:hypothetical protein